MNKAKWLLGELHAQQLPTCPFKINNCTTVYDVVKYIAVSEAILLNGQVLTLNWKAAYNRILDLKIYNQNEDDRRFKEDNPVP